MIKGFSKAQCNADKKAGLITYLTRFSYDPSAGIIDVFWAQHEGYFKGLCLDVQIETPSNPQLLVEADRAQISSAGSAASMMDYDADGSSRVVGVETVSNVGSNSIIMAGKGRTVKQIKDGSFGYTSVVNPTYLHMFAKAGVPISSIKFDALTVRNPVDTIQEVTGAQALLGSQDLILKSDHIPFTEINQSQLGVAGTTAVTYMNKIFLKQYPTAASNFLRAQVKALGSCLFHTTACEAYLGAQATAGGQGALYGAAAGQPVWNYSAKLLKAHETKPLGTFAAATWRPEYDQLKTYGDEAERLSGINQNVTVPPLSSMMNDRIIAKLYTKGKLIWP